jgi:hypothetical protein
LGDDASEPPGVPEDDALHLCEHSTYPDGSSPAESRFDAALWILGEVSLSDGGLLCGAEPSAKRARLSPTR